MGVSEKLKAALSLKGKKSIELASYYGISPQSMRNKFSRGSFSVEDLIKITDFLGGTLSIEIDNQKITLDKNDIRKV